MSVSGTIPARRPPASRFCSAQASSYGTSPSRRTSMSASGGAGGYLTGRVVRAAHQWPGFHMTEAELERLHFEHRKFLRGHVSRDRQVVGRRPKVLTDGQDLDVMRPQIAEDLDHLVQLLPQAEHDAGLDEDGCVHPLGALQQFQRARVAALRPYLWVQAGNGLDVVVEDVRARPHHGRQRRLVTHEIRDQNLDAALRNPLANLPDGAGEDGGAPILELVAVDRGDDGVLEAHPLDRFRHPNRLAQVEHARPTGLHRAEAAGPGTGVAQDHEGGRARVPALADVGAARLLTDGVQVEPAHDALQFGVVLAAGQADPEPVGAAGVDRDDGVALGAAVELDWCDVSHGYQYPKGRPNSASIQRNLFRKP